MSECIVGIDLGGTNMRVGIVSETGEVLHKVQEPTHAQSASGEDILERLGALVGRALAEAPARAGRAAGVGLGIPGPLDPSVGGVKNSPNLGQLDGLPIVEMLSEATGLPVLLENDANAAAFGEFWQGAGQGASNLVMATLGTGIGGGLIIDGQLLRGPDHTAAELGHVIVIDGGRPCACGSHGCIEAYASADSTVRRFREELEAGAESALAGAPAGELTCERIFAAARDGDALALAVVRETGRLLGVLAATMANLLNPERMIFAGGMIGAGDFLFDAIRRELRRRAFPVPGERLQILPAELGADAGLIGAAGCARTAFATSQS
jgi:glucokinase